MQYVLKTQTVKNMFRNIYNESSIEFVVLALIDWNYNLIRWFHLQWK